MKTIICGSRDIIDYSQVVAAIEASGFASEITEVVSGGARGVDTMGEDWAIQNKINVQQFIPRWEAGKWAGLKRNRDMAAYADAVIAIWDGRSTGTAHMISVAKEKGLKVFVHMVERNVDADKCVY